MEIAEQLIKDSAYIRIESISFTNIVDDVLLAIEGLVDLSFCLEIPHVDLCYNLETPRVPDKVAVVDPQRIFEERISQRFPKATSNLVSQHATASYFRFASLQNLRRIAEEGTVKSELPPSVETHTVVRTTFQDSGVRTSLAHESSYAKSVLSLTRRHDERYTDILPSLPVEGTKGEHFTCPICLHGVQIQSEQLWT
jgi:hypothetical protein